MSASPYLRTAHSGPFKAAQSYGPADDLLFHGRDGDASALAQFLADRPFAVLTAPSGTGKTSLLQAKTMPLLEAERWFTVYARPHDDPGASLKSALSEHLLPDPVAVAQAILRLIERAPGHGAATLADALDWYAGQPIVDRVAQRHFASPSSEESQPLPMFCRALRGSIGVSDLIEHFEALVADGPAMSLTPLTPLDAMVECMNHPRTHSLWAQWRERFDAGLGVAGWLSVFHDEWAPLRPGVSGVIIVLDQVEELFTQFAQGTLDRFLVDAQRWILPSGAAESRRPLNLTLALRKEFFADIVPHLSTFGSVERLAFFLNPMTAAQALDALGKPASLFGVEFEPAVPPGAGVAGDIGCLAKVLSLAVEDGCTFSQDDFLPVADGSDPLAAQGRFAPALISLIGAHLWVKLQGSDAPSVKPLSWDAFTQLIPNLDDVFMRFLADALAFFDDPSRAPGAASRFDALELLDCLVTSTGYRNIVAEVELKGRLPLPLATATDLLDDMDQQLKLVRRESRGRGRFVEIMHERLIDPVRRQLAASRQLDTARAALMLARDTLDVLPDDPNPTRDPVPFPHLRDAMVQYRDRVNLDRLSTKHLLRSLLCSGPDNDPAAGHRELGLASWKATVIDLSERLDDRSRDRAMRLPLLAGLELDFAIDAARESEASLDNDHLRHLALSALADRSAAAGERIRDAFDVLLAKEYR